MSRFIFYIVALAAIALSSTTTQAQITSIEGTHDLYGEVGHGLLTSIPPFSFADEYNETDLVSAFGPSAAGFSLQDPVFVGSNVGMSSQWSTDTDRASGSLTKAGQSTYNGQVGNSVNPFFQADSSAELVLMLEEAGTPYRVTVTWNLGPVQVAGDGSGFSAFSATLGNAVLAGQIGSIAGSTDNNVGNNLGPSGTQVFEGVTIIDSLALSLRLYGPGLSRGIAGCDGTQCGVGSVSDSSVITYEILLGEAALPADTDNDSVPDSEDNCTLVSNPDQYDSNDDGFGNLCDPDIDNNGVVNFADYVEIANRFLLTTVSPNWLADADLNNDGVINFSDIAIVSGYFLQPPGPSGTAP